MPNSVVFQQPFRRRGQNWLPPSRDNSVGAATGDGGILVGGAATVSFSLSAGTAVGSGGLVMGGTGSGTFVHGPQVPSDIIVEWDLDNDGDFSSGVEDITEFVLSAETFTGRDWPSLLTGAAGPGRFRATLRNDDDRFSYFNAGSPLTTPPFSLKTGRKLRVRTADASNPDPAPLARDRFRRTDGALGTEEGGLSWSGPLANDFTVDDQTAVAVTEGSTHIATLDVGGADYYVQTYVSVLGTLTNRVGLVYRYVNTTNYSLLILDVQESSLQLVDVVSGVETVIAGSGVEAYSGVTIGVLVSGSAVTAYMEGVPLFTDVAINTTAELVGMFAAWGTDDSRPVLDNFYVWDGITAEVAGILWTGDVSELTQTVTPGPEKLVTLQGSGWLSRLATQTVSPPTSTTGRRTGLLAGNVLAAASALHPPGPIDLGDVTTGVFVLPAMTAIEASRRVEETEYGFLYETQEGPIGFESRTARSGALSLATFSDAPGGKYGYSKITPYDWRREVFNRVTAGVSPYSLGVETVLFTDPGPYTLTSGQSVDLTASYEDAPVARWTGHTRDVSAPGTPSGVSVITDFSTSDTTNFVVSLPATVTPGDLLLIAYYSVGSGGGFTVPTGWTKLDIYSPTVLAKVAVGTEDGTTVSITSDSARGWAANIWRVTNWYGSLSGVTVTPGSNSATSSTVDPDTVTHTWGAIPTLFLAITGYRGNTSQTGIPSGYITNTFAESTAGFLTGMGSSQRIASVATENPGTHSIGASVPWVSRTIAIRGPGTVTTVTSDAPAGSEGGFSISYNATVGGTSQSHQNIEVTGIPLIEGSPAVVTVDDYDSQDDHNAIKTYQNAANLFGSTADAQEYAELVLATHADDRPILSLSFYATKSGAYRNQAFTRRVGDKITLEADHTTGLGVNQDFFIESIGHQWSQGTRLWMTTWELSPA